MTSKERRSLLVYFVEERLKWEIVQTVSKPTKFKHKSKQPYSFSSLYLFRNQVRIHSNTPKQIFPFINFYARIEYKLRSVYAKKYVSFSLLTHRCGQVFWRERAAQPKLLFLSFPRTGVHVAASLMFPPLADSFFWLRFRRPNLKWFQLQQPILWLVN